MARRAMILCNSNIRYTAGMMLIVNGQPRECPEGISLEQFIEDLALKADRVAIELNRQIASRGRWKDIFLHEGDRLEIVHFVGGGLLDDQT
jgi:sulfur carrier protein